ncbi:MAG: alpha/beta hydrolase [bacterium]|nr:alpha/beta hydrolase [bacterium]
MKASKEYRESQYDRFTISEYGTGSPRRICVGGLAYSPGDYKALASKLPGTTYVVDNPMHTGMMDWNLEELRSKYIEIMNMLGCSIVVGHSLGCLDTIEMCKSSTVRIKGAVLLTPPLNDDLRHNKGVSKQQLNTEQFGMLDTVIGELCRDMSDEEYLAFLLEHYTLYGHRIKVNYKKGMPKPEQLTHLIDLLVKDMHRLRTKFLAILGTEDIWYPGAGQCPTFPENVRIQAVQGAHYIHRIHAAKIAELIFDWEQKL